MDRIRYSAKVKLYKQGVNSQGKWCSVGTAFALESGQINLVLDTMPVKDSQWDGTIALFPEKD